MMGTDLKEEIRTRYAEAAVRADAGQGCSGESCCAENGCCGDAGPDAFGASLYDPQTQAGLPQAALLASLGCGNPIAVADLHDGEVVLDLGSGGGIDVLLSARRVGPVGLAYGVDMTDEMLELARRNAREAGVTNAHFLKGDIENIPLPDASIDVVISNCVVNLSTDKPQVLREIFRVLRVGGRVGISDVVVEDRLAPEERADRGSYVGCIAGALSKSEYEAGLTDAGFGEISVVFTNRVADGIHSAIIKAAKLPTRRRRSHGRTGSARAAV
jgi:arsenite methyltransferase